MNPAQVATLAQTSLPPMASPEKKTATPPRIDSQKKAAELRAKLLANRPGSAASARPNTPSKSKELSTKTKGNSQDQLKEKRSLGNLAQFNAQVGNRIKAAKSGVEADLSVQVSSPPYAACYEPKE